MKFKLTYIKELCEELESLQINIEPKEMETILRTQRQDYLNYTDGIDLAQEFEQLLIRIDESDV